MNMLPGPVGVLVSAAQADGAVTGVLDQFIGADRVEAAASGFPPRRCHAAG